MAVGNGGGSGNGEQNLSVRLMDLLFGCILVAVVGAAVIAVGISQIVKGVKQKFVEDLDSGVTQLVRRLGTVGYCAKGVALVIIGGLFGYAALTYDPKKAGGLDAALSIIREQPFGTVLLVIMAVGFASFGVFCFVGPARRATEVRRPRARSARRGPEPVVHRDCLGQVERAEYHDRPLTAGEHLAARAGSASGSPGPTR